MCNKQIDEVFETAAKDVKTRENKIEKENIKEELIEKIKKYKHDTECMEAWKYDLKIVVESYLKKM